MSQLSAHEKERIAKAFQKARVAQEFRAGPKGMFHHYVRTRWKKQALATAAFAALIAVAWVTGSQFAAVGIFGFCAGRLMRDYQWFAYLASEWESSCEIIDWAKVELMATSDPPR